MNPTPYGDKPSNPLAEGLLTEAPLAEGLLTEAYRLLSTIINTRYLVLALLLAYFAQGMAQVRQASITFDEGPHLAVGYTTLRTGDFRLQPVHIHPPLANVLAAAPLLLQHDLPHPTAISGWEIASLSALTDKIVWQYPHPARLATASRLPILWLGMLLGALVFRWAASDERTGSNQRQSVGRRSPDRGQATSDERTGSNQRRNQRPHPRRKAGLLAGLLALTLYAFDPNLIAHGALITTDMAAVFFMVATLYSVAHAAKLVTWLRPWTRDVVIGLLLGLAQLTKVSALMLVPVVGLSLGLRNIRQGRRSGDLAQLILQSAFVLTTAAFVIWAGYGFQWTQIAINVEPLLQITERLNLKALAVSSLRTTEVSLKIPAGTHLLIYQSLREHYELGHPTFLMGQVSTHGWWWYFPVAFALKTPLPTLILATWAAVRSLNQARHKVNIQFKGDGRETWPNVQFLLFPLLYTLSSLFSTVNIGYRHLLPLLPFLYIGIGRTLGTTLGHSATLGVTERPKRSGVILSVVEGPGRLTSTRNDKPDPFPTSPFPLLTSIALFFLLLWQITGTLHIAPHYLTFFNAIAGGAKGGYRYLVDSNLDWGQNLWDFKRWLTENNAETTTGLKSASGIYYAHYSPARPSSYGINADFLPPDPRAVPLTPWQPAPGIYAIGATVLQGPYAPDINTYAWFRTHTPTTRLGNALWIYDVPARPPVTWAVVCAGANLASEVLRDNIGQPHTANASRLHIIHTDCAQTYVHPAATHPGLYVFAGVDQIFSLDEGLLTAPPELEVQLRDKQGNITHTLYRITEMPAGPTHPLTHFTTTGPLDFLGYTLYPQPSLALQPGATLELQTTWRVTASPGRPLSLMAHLIGPDGTAAAVGDSMGYPLEQWQPGDLFIQRHTMTVPVQAASGTYTLLTGAYWLDNLERWTFYDTSKYEQAKQEAIPLTTLQMKKENVTKKSDF